MEFCGEMQHTPETIRRLSDVQYRAFRPGLRLLWLTVGGACVVFAARNSGNILLFCLLMLAGCWLLLNQNLPALHRADKLTAAGGGTLPHTVYCFQEQSFQVSSTGYKKTVAYKDLYALFEDREYFYLFLNRQSAYMVARESLADPEQWKACLEQRSGRRFHRTGTPGSGAILGKSLRKPF